MTLLPPGVGTQRPARRERAAPLPNGTLALRDKRRPRRASPQVSTKAGELHPALTSSLKTNDLLAERGFTYTLDWANDDLPYDLTVGDGRLLSVPYASEVNDIPLCHIRHFDSPQFGQPSSTRSRATSTRRRRGERWPET
jgi:hypothetical protein